MTLLGPPVPKMPATCSSTLTTSLTMGSGLAGTTLRTGAGLVAGKAGTGAPEIKEVESGNGVSDEGGKAEK